MDIRDLRTASRLTCSGFDGGIGAGVGGFEIARNGKDCEPRDTERDITMFSEHANKFQEIERSYWRYYCELEQEMLQTRRFVDFNKEIFKAYSLEYLKLYQAVCGEIDAFVYFFSGI